MAEISDSQVLSLRRDHLSAATEGIVGTQKSRETRGMKLQESGNESQEKAPTSAHPQQNAQEQQGQHTLVEGQPKPTDVQAALIRDTLLVLVHLLGRLSGNEVPMAQQLQRIKCLRQLTNCVLGK